MTDPQAAPMRADDIEDDAGTASARLDRQADAILAQAETRAFEPRPLRQAVREDAAQARAWGRVRAARLRGVMEDRPISAALYGLGLGVVIGLLVAR